MRLKYYCFKVQQTAAERARKKKKRKQDLMIKSFVSFTVPCIELT